MSKLHFDREREPNEIHRPCKIRLVNGKFENFMNINNVSIDMPPVGYISNAILNW
jgi:hypothetical protein